MRSQNPHSLSHDERIELWNLENEQFEELIIQPSLSYYNRYFERGPVQTDGGLGWRSIWHRLQEDDAACLQLLRMSLGVFRSLCDILGSKYGLHPTLNVSIEESVAMFVEMVAQDLTVRALAERYQRSVDTVDRKLDQVLSALLKLAADIIKPSIGEFTTPSPVLVNNDR